MSQNAQALEKVKKLSGMEDLVLRPLSAKLLPPSRAELMGWVDREKLLDIKADELGKSKNEVLKFLINNKLEDTKKEFDLLNELDKNYKELGFQN